jgi:cytochrome c553
MKCATLVLAFVGAALLCSCANPERSRDLANPAVSATTLALQVCSDCHGFKGNAVSPNFPNLAGQTPAYLAAQLRGFKSHDRQDPAGFEYMWGLSRSLTDGQIDALASYYASQQPEQQPIEGDLSRLPAGRSIFESGLPAQNVPACSACHGNLGQGTGVAPRIAGQHVDYIVKQLVVFQRTDGRPAGAAMKAVAHELSADDVASVAAYAQSLSGR